MLKLKPSHPTCFRNVSRGAACLTGQAPCPPSPVHSPCPVTVTRPTVGSAHWEPSATVRLGPFPARSRSYPEPPSGPHRRLCLWTMGTRDRRALCDQQLSCNGTETEPPISGKPEHAPSSFLHGTFWLNHVFLSLWSRRPLVSQEITRQVTPRVRDDRKPDLLDWSAAPGDGSDPGGGGLGGPRGSGGRGPRCRPQPGSTASWGSSGHPLLSTRPSQTRAPQRPAPVGA